MIYGRDFIAVEPLYSKDGELLASPGETCERVPAVSLAWLKDAGHIVPGRPQAAEPARKG